MPLQFIITKAEYGIVLMHAINVVVVACLSSPFLNQLLSLLSIQCNQKQKQEDYEGDDDDDDQCDEKIGGVFKKI